MKLILIQIVLFALLVSLSKETSLGKIKAKICSPIDCKAKIFEELTGTLSETKDGLRIKLESDSKVPKLFYSYLSEVNEEKINYLLLDYRLIHRCIFQSVEKQLTFSLQNLEVDNKGEVNPIIEDYKGFITFENGEIPNISSWSENCDKRQKSVTIKLKEYLALLNEFDDFQGKANEYNRAKESVSTLEKELLDIIKNNMDLDLESQRAYAMQKLFDKKAVLDKLAPKTSETTFAAIMQSYSGHQKEELKKLVLFSKENPFWDSVEEMQNGKAGSLSGAVYFKKPGSEDEEYSIELLKEKAGA